MSSTGRLDATVLIATYNRAALLERTLRSLGRMRVASDRHWDVVVVDNNSTDATREVVERVAASFPVPLRHLFEARQGRSSALNAGIAAAGGTVIAMTDDDVVVDERWLDAACDALLASPGGAIAYAGGPVRPLWEAPPPPWLDLERGDLWGTIAIQDHGPDRFVYEDRKKVPLGANMAATRELFRQAGGFRADLGRTTGKQVLGQEVPDLLARVRALGFRGMYLPSMAVDHHIPAARLTRRYFRRWWFGKGVSRSLLERDRPITELGLDLRTTPHVFGMPRYMFGCAWRDLMAWVRHAVRGRAADAFRHEMMIVYFLGYLWTRIRQSPQPYHAAPVAGRS